MPAQQSRFLRGSGRVLPFLLLALGSAQFALHYVWAGYPFLDLRYFTREVIPMPYQGRILTSWLFQATVARQPIYDFIAHRSAHLPLHLRDPYLLLELVLVFVSLVGAGLACQAAVRRLCGDRSFARWSSLLILGMSLYLTFFESYQLWLLPYDLPSLAFFSIGVWLVVSDRMLILLPIFVLGTLNRETYIFITVFAVLYGGFQSSLYRGSFLAGVRRVAPFAAVQIAFWVALRLWLIRRFAHNLSPGEPRHGFVLQLGVNLHSILNPMQWPLLATSFAPLVLPLVFGWRWIEDKSLAMATACILALWFVGMFFVGVITEVRIFNELISFVAPCIACIVWTRFVQPSRAYRTAQADAGN